MCALRTVFRSVIPRPCSAHTERRSAHEIKECRTPEIRSTRLREGLTMIDHVVLGVHHLDESKHFYENALRPLGVKVVVEEPKLIGFGGDSGQPFFWLALREPSHRVHVAFTAP